MSETCEQPLHNSTSYQRLTGKTAIVTGGSSGIGRETCLALSKEGAAVVVVDLPKVKKVQKTVEEVLAVGSSRKALGLELDIRSESDMIELSQRAIDEFGRIDILVHCAGILRPKDSGLKTVDKVLIPEWDEIISTNLHGTFLANKAVLSSMIKQKSGHIINLSSTSGLKGRAFDSAYSASKFGVIGLSESLAEEVKKYNIKVQTITPGAINTPLWEQNGPIKPPQYAIPPARVANLIVYMLTLPEDTNLANITISPFVTRQTK